MVRVRRASLSPLAWLIDFTIAECNLMPGECWSTTPLLTMVETIRSTPGFQRAGQFKSFLRERPDRLFDAALFDVFWQQHCPPLRSPDAWGEELELG